MRELDPGFLLLLTCRDDDMQLDHVQQGRVVIPRSTRPERMIENLSVFDFRLTADEISLIDALDRGPGGRVGPNSDTYEG